MLVQELKASIQAKTVLKSYGSVLIFIGEEGTLQNLYCKQVAKSLGGDICFAEDDYLSIRKSIEINSPLNKSKVFVIRNSSQVLKNEGMLETIKTKIAKGKLLILIFDKLDKRKSFFKDNKDIICEFEKMTTSQLTKIIHKTFPGLVVENCDLLCQLVNNDYGRLLLEMDKLNCINYDYMIHNIDVDDNDLFEEALKTNLIYQEVSDTSFQLLDAILNRDPKKAFTLLTELREFDTDSFKMLGLVYSNFKNMLLLGNNPNINRFVKIKLNNAKKNYSSSQVIRILDLICSIEQGIKSGKIDNENALEYMIIQILL